MICRIRPTTLIAALLAAATLPLPGAAGAVLTMNDPGVEGAGATNTNLATSFASNLTAASALAVDSDADGRFNATLTNGATPDVALAWAAAGNGAGSPVWQFHAWTNAGGGALQLEQSIGLAAATSPFTQNAVHQITFTPTATTGVAINSFNFIGDTNGDVYRYDWRIVRTGDSTIVASGQTAQWTTNTATSPNNAAPTVTPNFTGTLGTAYRLDLAQSAGFTGNSVNIAIDNLNFTQVPEPTALLAAPLAGLLLARRRRRMA